uniref:Putative plant transposon protein domain-containing protein n=1 Tax=Solanum tuberosum TaxID=4113 RepID=M1DXL9_SOLTU
MFLYGLGHTLPINRAKVNYRMNIVRSGAFQSNAKQRKSIFLWLARHLATDEKRIEWVSTPSLSIKKATLSFVAKFFWLLVWNRVSPTQVDNVLTWDPVVMVVALVSRMEVNFARMLIAEIHERTSKDTTTLLIPASFSSKAGILEYRFGIMTGCFSLCLEVGGPDGHTAPTCEAIDVETDSRVRCADGANDGPSCCPPSSTRLSLSLPPRHRLIIRCWMHYSLMRYRHLILLVMLGSSPAPVRLLMTLRMGELEAARRVSIVDEEMHF